MTVPIPVGFVGTGRRPGFFATIENPSGALSLANLQRVVLLCGTKLSSGTAVPDVDIVDIIDPASADLAFGAGSELARMCYAALRIPGAKSIKAIACSEAGSATAATVTLTVTGTWATSGVLGVEINGDYFEVPVNAIDTVTDVATRIATYVTARPSLAMSGGNTAGVATLTCKSKGARGKLGSVYLTTTGLPAGCVVTPAGSATLPGNGVRPGASSTGTLTDDVTLVLAALFPGHYPLIAAAQADATNEALWETQVDGKAALGEQRYEHVVMATTGTTSAAISLATTTCNDFRVQLCYQRSCRNHPSEIAAATAAKRSVKESAYINTGFDGEQLEGIKAQKVDSDRLSSTEITALINAGVTPVDSNDNGAFIVLSCTTRSLLSSLPDYRVADTNKAVVPDYVSENLGAIWYTQFLFANPVIAPDPAPGQPPRPSGVGTPSNWDATATGYLKSLEKPTSGIPVLVDVDANPPDSSYVTTPTPAIVSVIPVKPADLQHKIGVTIRQIAA